MQSQTLIHWKLRFWKLLKRGFISRWFFHKLIISKCRIHLHLFIAVHLLILILNFISEIYLSSFTLYPFMFCHFSSIFFVSIIRIDWSLQVSHWFGLFIFRSFISLKIIVMSIINYFLSFIRIIEKVNSITTIRRWLHAIMFSIIWQVIINYIKLWNLIHFSFIQCFYIIVLSTLGFLFLLFI